MQLVEERMLARPSRRIAYREYQRRVPLCIPMLKGPPLRKHG